MKQTAAVGGDRLAMAGAEAEKGAELVIASTEPLGGPECLEAPHTSDPAFDAPVILLHWNARVPPPRSISFAGGPYANCTARMSWPI